MEDALKYSLIPFASLLVLSSCAWYRNVERSLVADDEKQALKRSSRPVPREQYDQLLIKYEELSKKYENLKEKPSSSDGSLVDELQKNQVENFSQGSTNVETETVDLFPAGEKPNLMPIEVPADVESQLNLYRRGISLKQSNPGEATKIFQQLENQAISPVRARARFQVGDILLAKGQYDLALQVFENLINKNSDSGIVLDALRGAVIASDKLGIVNKKDQYTSMLKDVFGTGQDI